MIPTLLLATALSLGHGLVRGEPATVRPHVRDAVRLALHGYCDASGQPTILLENEGRASVLVGWTMTAVKPWCQDEWPGATVLEPGRFTGWMAPADLLSVTITYDDHGETMTETTAQACPAEGGNLR